MKKQMDPKNFYSLNDRRGRWLTAFGRLKPSVKLPEAKASLAPLSVDRLRQCGRLLIARSTARLALGATRGRIISQLLVETLLLSLAGGLADSC